ncbi:transposase [Streptomyces mirabilis]
MMEATSRGDDVHEVMAMSLRAHEPLPVPDLTAQVARAAFPDGCLGMRLRDALGPVFRDDDFADLFPRRGRPALSPGQLALVCVLQFVEGLSDRQTATAVRERIGWKYALSLELTDPGFDFSVLCEFRARLIAGKAERRVFDRLLKVCKDHKLLGSRGAARTDSTYVLGSVRVLNRLELVGETVRAALNALAIAAPRWLGGWMPPGWADRYGHRVENYRLPQTEAERLAFATAVGADGAVILTRVDTDDAPAVLEELEAVQVLRAVWPQQYDLAANSPRWRATEELPPHRSGSLPPTTSSADTRSRGPRGGPATSATSLSTAAPTCPTWSPTWTPPTPPKATRI